MRTVNIGELKDQLSAHLQYVRDGEEVVICDQNLPIARILPFRRDAEWDREAALVASGAMKMPEREMDWESFFAMRAGSVTRNEAVAAVIESRGDW